MVFCLFLEGCQFVFVAEWFIFCLILMLRSMTSELWAVFLMEVAIVRFLLSISQIVYVMILTWWFTLSSNFLFTYSYLSYLVVWLMCWNLSYGLCSSLFFISKLHMDFLLLSNNFSRPSLEMTLCLSLNLFKKDCC